MKERTLTIIDSNSFYSCKVGSFRISFEKDGFVIRNSEEPHHGGFMYNMEDWNYFSKTLTDRLTQDNSDIVIVLSEQHKNECMVDQGVLNQ